VGSGVDEKVTVTVSCINNDAERCGVTWNAGAAVRQGNIYLDDEIEWLCPQCGEVGKSVHVRNVWDAYGDPS
jgi:hypothetical protein